MTNEPADLEAMLREIEKNVASRSDAMALAHLANDGKTWQGKYCECDPESNAAPCRYCAIHRGLLIATTELQTTIPTLCQIIRQLQGRVRELEQDKARLDWLDTAHLSSIRLVHNHHVGKTVRERLDALIQDDAVNGPFEHRQPFSQLARQSDSLRGEGKGEG